MTPRISIVVPTYQHARSLPRCLDSILAQTGVDTEIIVVDDGSTDGTTEALAPYRDRVRIVRQENRGSNPARNRGLNEARGEFVIFCDADIVMRPDMLKRMQDALDHHPEASYAYSGFYFGWKHFRGVPWSPERLRRQNYVHTTSLVRRRDFPGFDNAVRRFQDWDVWLSMLATGKPGVLVPETLFLCMIDGKSRIGSSWLPSFVYRIPWRLLGWMPGCVKTYFAARDIIAAKHQL